MAEQNPKIQKWLDIGKRRFAENGAAGIHINEMSEEIGVAKTSFYFFFNSKEEYLEQLFAFWVYESTDRLDNMINKIKDPGKRFLALADLIKDNLENELFYIQIKMFALKNKSARKYVDEVYYKRNEIALGIFVDKGLPKEEALAKAQNLKTFFYGQIVRSIGYTPSKGFTAELLSERLKMFELD